MDFTLVALLVLVVGMMIFSFYSNRKRRAALEKAKTEMIVGVKIVTTFGVYGRIVSIDEELNRAVLEISPKSTMTVHRSALGQIVDVEAVAPAAGVAVNTELVSEPDFGERVEESASDVEAKVRKNTSSAITSSLTATSINRPVKATKPASKAAVDKTTVDKTTVDKTTADKTTADKTTADKTAVDKTTGARTSTTKSTTTKTEATE